MAPQPRWYERVSPATGVVPCQGEQHRLTWRRGKVKLEDHDLSAERALLAFGGEPCACLRALRLWSDQFGMPPELFDQMPRWMGAEAVLAPAALDHQRHLGMLLSWERAWKMQGRQAKQGRLVEREVKARAVPALRAHLTAAKGAFGSRLVRGVSVVVVPAGRAPALSGRMDRVSVSAEATLSSDWVLDVWARDMAVVGGALVLTAAGDEPASVTAVRWVAGGGSEATPRAFPATVDRGPEGAWALRWDDEGGS